MKITFWGAAQEVTGAMHQVTTGGNQYILDCRMYQGRRKDAERQNRNFPFPPKTITAVMLSHAHIDHRGNLPLLVQKGFTGSITSTPASIIVCRAMLSDTAHMFGSSTMVLESEGVRVHDSETTVMDKLADVVYRTVERGGRLIVPAFAVRRVQQLVLLLHQLANEKRFPKVPIFVDSPLAVNVTEVYRAQPECFDEECAKPAEFCTI